MKWGPYILKRGRIGHDCYFFLTVLRIRIRWIPKIWSSRIRIRKIMRIHRSRSQGQNINQKCKKKITLKAKIWTIKKRGIIKISWFLNGSSSFSLKISEKNKTNWNSGLLKNLVNFEEITWIRIYFSKNWIRIKIKWILITVFFNVNPGSR